jgi:thioredoxin 1
MALFKKRFKAPQLSSMEEFDEITSSGKPVLVDFYQYGCQPCQVMDGIVNEIAEQFGEKAHVVKANVDTVPDLFYKFKVKSTPTFIVLSPMDQGLHQRWRQSGLVKKDVMVDHMSRAVSAAGASG